MSYILDALRRADAERVRGAVPGIHAQQVPVNAETGRHGPAPWVWMAGGAALLLAALLVWQGMAEDAPAPAPVAALPPPLPAPAPRAPAVVSLPPIAAEPERPRAASPRADTPRPASATADARILALHELPEAIRRQIPTMTVGGSIYSKDAASRFLIINGQIFHEGNKITPDLVLEEIKLKAAVMRFKGQRFSMTF